MATYGEKARPRALFIGIEQKEIDSIKSLFPTYQLVGSTQEVRQEEWDVLITREDYVNAAPHIFVIGLGCRGFGPIISQAPLNEGCKLYCTYGASSLATEFSIPDDLSSELRRLIEIDLLPKLKDDPKKRVLTSDTIFTQLQAKVVGPSLKDAGFEPFISTTENNPLAGLALRNKSGAEVWCLPFREADLLSWCTFAIKKWHRKDPSRFPVNPGWEHQPNWMTIAEAKIATQVAETQKLRQETTDRLNKQERELTAQLYQIRKQSDDNERVLLTGQDEQLVKAVDQAFRELGFAVQDMDKILPANDRREDLRVTLPDAPPWIALCEVKGYYKGAQLGDLMKMGRFRNRFFQERQQWPDRCWYVVNTFLQSDPAIRSKPLSGNANEVQIFADDGGLVIATKDLFRLLMAVRAGQVTRQDAQAKLRDPVGVFEF